MPDKAKRSQAQMSGASPRDELVDHLPALRAFALSLTREGASAVAHRVPCITTLQAAEAAVTAMEALCELGELELAARGMADVERCQRSDGAIPAYPDVTWVCSTGMAQYAIVWYTLGRKEAADRAIRYLEKIQNKSGGFFGSYGKGAQYIAGGEISWAVKYFLDAYRLKLQGEGKHA